MTELIVFFAATSKYAPVMESDSEEVEDPDEINPQTNQDKYRVGDTKGSDRNDNAKVLRKSNCRNLRLEQ